MKRRRKLLLVAAASCVALPFFASPAGASEVCGDGHVLGVGLPLPSCQHCPPGIHLSDTGAEPFVMVELCVNP